MYPYLHISRIPQTENGTNRKWQLLFVCCKWKKETVNFHLIAENGKGKTKVCFPWSLNGKCYSMVAFSAWSNSTNKS
jgi:hypothetical protein